VALIALITLQLIYVYGKSLFPRFSVGCVWDVLQGVFTYPFASLPAFGKTLKKAFNYKGVKSSNALKIFIGLLIVLPISVIIISILMSADESFEKLIHSIVSIISIDFWRYIGHLIFGLLFIFPFLFSYLFSIRNKTKTLNAGANIEYKKLAGLDRVITYTILSVIIVIYALFFASQFSYLFSAFSNTLPQEFNFSSFARRGFFELVFLSAFNMVILFLGYLFIKRKDEKLTSATKAYFVVFTLLSVLLMVSAFSKLVMYIDNYGLTYARVLAGWFMIVLAILFVLIAVKSIVPKIRIIRNSIIMFIAMFVLLNVVSLDYVIPAYNVAKYQSDGKEIDIEMFYDMSDAMVVPVSKLLNDKNQDVAQKAREILQDRAYWINQDDDWQSFSISRYFAKKAIKENNIAPAQREYHYDGSEIMGEEEDSNGGPKIINEEIYPRPDQEESQYDEYQYQDQQDEYNEYQ
jgi:hypothetical protein